MWCAWGRGQTLLRAQEPEPLDFSHVPQLGSQPCTNHQGNKGRALASVGMAGLREVPVRSPCFSFRLWGGKTEVQEGEGLLRIMEKADDQLLRATGHSVQWLTS